MNKIEKEFFKGKNVLITGHTGFKGSWLTLILNILGSNIMGISLKPNSKNDMYVISKIDQICNSKILNICDVKKSSKLVKEFEPDLIFHLAAQPLVIQSYKNPIDTYLSNVIGSLSILESLKQFDKKCATIIITTDKVYENLEIKKDYKENDALGGYDPYSSSKACVEIMVKSFRNSFFNLKDISNHKKSISTVRAGNVIGGGDWSKNRLIPDLVRSIIKNKQINLRNPNSTRPWQHVLDPLMGYLKLAYYQYLDPEKFSSEWNFGPENNENIKVIDLAKLFIDKIGKGSIEILKNGNSMHEANLLSLEIGKAKRELNWKPVLNTNKSVELTVNWYEQFINKKTDMRIYSENQIKEILN
ncbi:MAG: CDP-glucose 4,6-dehydratase [Flavobacteriaceae bacterium]|nr:CDP-glucose 4,6-dehydratase [Flavobacteriaceae bacterium]|tara:strand:+ start:14765 stop:15841 length:1077 start_codon:yes stop_codon:yes gene_type:complete